jgi:hypothetical protein
LSAIERREFDLELEDDGTVGIRIEGRPFLTCRAQDLFGPELVGAAAALSDFPHVTPRA